MFVVSPCVDFSVYVGSVKVTDVGDVGQNFEKHMKMVVSSIEATRTKRKKEIFEKVFSELGGGNQEALEQAKKIFTARVENKIDAIRKRLAAALEATVEDILSRQQIQALPSAKEVDEARVKMTYAISQLTRLKIGSPDTDIVTPTLTTFQRAQAEIDDVAKYFSQKESDEKLISTSRNLDETLNQFNMFIPRSPGDYTATFDQFLEVSSHVDLTTGLPFQYQAVKKMKLALAAKCSKEVLKRISETQQYAVVAMATVSACQLIERENGNEATEFEEKKLKPLGIKLCELPKSVQERLAVLSASADSADGS